MPDGQYTPDERAFVDEVAKQVASGELVFAEAVDTIARRLGRDPRGVKLFLGRVVNRIRNEGAGLDGAGGVRARRGRPRGESSRRGRGRRRMSFEDLVATTKEKAQELQGLRQRRDALDRRIAELEAELGELRNRLLRAIGLDGGEG